ncbi:MAG: hypothetical protein GY753_09795 [Gammaproteobacteria bacterium]|nr:hypothetical protein [Gammaproteobacteria bacterium]
MILDSENLFSDDQVPTDGSASTNIIDLGAAQTPIGGAAPLAQDLGAGIPVPLLIQVTAAMTGTLVVSVQTDDNAGFSSASTVATHTFPATAPAGSQASLQFVPQGVDERYVRLWYAGGTVGSVTAGLTMGVQTN